MKSNNNSFIKNKISIIGNAKNEGDLVKQTLDAIVANTHYPNFEIILIDDGSTDGSFDNIDPKNYKIPVKIIKNKQSIGFAKSRNNGAKIATGEYLIFIDCHIFPTPNWIEELLKGINMPESGMSTVKIMGLKKEDVIVEGKIHTYIFNDYFLNTDWSYEDRNTIYEVPLACGCCQMIKKEVFDKVLGYTEEFIRVGREDTELCLKICLLGYKIFSSPNSYIKHHFKDTWGEGFNIHYPVVHNALTFGFLHFSDTNFMKMLNSVKSVKFFPQAILSVLSNQKLKTMKTYYKSIFKYDDLWYFDKFKDYFKTMNLNYKSSFKNRISEISDPITEYLSAGTKGIDFMDKNEKILDFKKDTYLTNSEIIELVNEKLKCNS